MPRHKNLAFAGGRAVKVAITASELSARGYEVGAKTEEAVGPRENQLSRIDDSRMS